MRALWRTHSGSCHRACGQEYRNSGAFDCTQVSPGSRGINENESLLYIGQGRFAVVVYEDPSDKRKFTIVRQIEWEGREARAEWRSEIAGHYSQVH